MISTDFPTKQVTLKPEDFDPPLKRKEPTVPGYWTLEEIAAEIEMTSRKVQYDVLGRPEIGLKPFLKAYKVAKVLLVPDEDALEYIQRYRNRKKS
ncbi:DNA-binding protein [Candidatus Gracilibacteria bacterium]|nr:DNA-binding protein [Candidatus Gracilibacteria bacterium]NJM89266.1 DNA-binding protein [Hydrococcus sp. RU_2_2]NJP21056.1 DNA-binding protein [Hydrococcus sp. CRU_1_1]NJQ96573.1 DNA-binding protein [Hydrococcus sp. CSU_1_8]